MKQFTVITKDGSKWLRPTDVLSDVFNVIYIGSHPEGTILNEREVRKITQVEDYPEWITPHPDNLEDWLDTSHEIRTVYVDAEPQCPECGKYCSCPEEDLYDAVADYRNNHPEPSRDRQVSESEYWKMRALSAEKLIEMEPSDPKTYDEFCRLRDEWHELKNQDLYANRL